ncbi:four helix bundle protein [Clostridium cochlearium]
MKDDILSIKSKKFALKIIKLYKMLTKEKKEYIISKQLLKSATSIGANIREAQFAESKKDFISKMSIALKETGETLY